MTGAILTEAARAKINLALHVVGRRADGYHLLDMLIGFAGTGDILEARLSDDLSLTVTGPGAAALVTVDPADNLVLRAARALSELAAPRARPGAAIVLHKHLPVASGIGGGSADAGAALRLLCRLWEIDPERPEVAAIARSLGADVTMCLGSRPVRAEGIGHDITPVGPLPPFGLLLANPGVPVSTPAVFGALARRDNPGLPALPPPGDAAALLAFLAATRNDLETPARSIAPVIGDVLARLRSLDGVRFTRMSGSGATCFALFDRADEAARAATALAAEQPDWWVRASVLQ